jgi:ABC-type transport system substrate-binding protein
MNQEKKHMKKTTAITIFLGFLALVGSFVGCSKKGQDEGNVLHLALTAQIKGMDPIYANDLYSSNEVARVYEGLLEYHYLKRPYTLVPSLAEAMPTVSPDGLTYTFTIKKNVLFQDSPCFPNGKGRALTADDFVYSIKRTADLHTQALGWWVLDGKIKGLNEWRDKYAQSKESNYDDVIEGLKSLDPHTLQITLAKPFPQFLYALAMPFFFAVPKEAVQHFGKEFINHPVGTGPFVLPEFTQTNQLVYTKNPTYREAFFPNPESPEFDTDEFKKHAGKRLPLADKIIANIMIESQPRWLKFQKGELDVVEVPKDNFETAITKEKKLHPDMLKKDFQLLYAPSLDLAYIAFNHDLPLFKNKKLRQAISLAYDGQKLNDLFYNSIALPAQSIIPPGIAGYDASFQNPYRQFNLEKAKTLLAEAGFPGGKGLPEIIYDVAATTTGRQMGEFFQKSMEAIGIKIKVEGLPWPELQKKIKTRSSMMHGIAWGADYPDAENFLQLLYGPNSSPGSNGANYQDPSFDQSFEKASIMQDSPERTALYKELNLKIAEEMPIIFGVHRMSFVLHQSWLKNYTLTEFTAGQSKYLSVDLEKKKSALAKF